MTDDITKFDSRLDLLQDQFAALRLDVEKTIATLQQMIEEEQEE
jgi:hypothetical protein